MLTIDVKITQLFQTLAELASNTRDLYVSYSDQKSIDQIALQIGDLLFKHWHDISNLQNKYIFHLYEQLTIRFMHLKVETKFGKFPREATISFINDIYDFSSMIAACKEDKPIYLNYAHNYDAAYMEYLMHKDAANVQSIIAEPEKSYNHFQTILKNNPNAPTLEFEFSVKYLLCYACEPQLLQHARQNKFLALMRQNAIDSLLNVQQNKYPYLDTINAIEKFIAFLDVYVRGRDANIKKPPSLYHSIKWGYHVHQLKSSTPDCILFPTLQPLSIMDMLNLRPYMIFFIGICTDYTFADGHDQTPLEFWIHDFNHSRRMFEQQSFHAKDLAMTQQQYIQLCNINVMNTVKQYFCKETESIEEKKMLHAQKLILYEILHEDAMPPHPEVILNALLRAPNEKTTMVIAEKVIDDKVVYFNTTYTTILAYVYNKIASNHYGIQSKKIKPEQYKFQTREFIAYAAINLCERLGFKLSPEQIAQIKVNANDPTIPMSA